MVGSSGTAAGYMPEVFPVSNGYGGLPLCTVPLVVSKFMAHNPALVSKDMGTFHVFQHHIKLAPDAVPTAIKTCQVSYGIEEKVVAVARLLDEQGISEKADKGDWAYPLVTPAKVDGTVHMTTDLSRLNKYVIPVCYPLPMLPESSRSFGAQHSCPHLIL